jgi:hypothetical protein
MSETLGQLPHQDALALGPQRSDLPHLLLADAGRICPRPGSLASGLAQSVSPAPQAGKSPHMTNTSPVKTPLGSLYTPHLHSPRMG